MKATDLMIGDWVCFDGDTSHECPVQIDGISKEEAGVDGDWYDIWEPIPLTPEILEKNGWVLDEIDGSYRHPDLGFWIGGRGAPFGFMVSSIYKEIYYVHELQHALRLCGIENPIRIFEPSI